MARISRTAHGQKGGQREVRKKKNEIKWGAVGLTIPANVKGSIKLTETYGRDLVCVRYRYNPRKGVRYTTVELVVYQKAWKKKRDQ